MIPRIAPSSVTGLVEVSLGKSTLDRTVLAEGVAALVVNQTSPNAYSLLQNLYVTKAMDVEL